MIKSPPLSLLLLALLPLGLPAAPRQTTGDKFLPEGQFVWHEIVTPDPAATEKFYAAALDWKSVPSPVASTAEKPYVMFSSDGHLFAGIAPTMNADDRARWTGWVQVRDTDLAADTAMVAGGLVIRQPREHLIGRVSEIADPGQARFCIVQLNIRRPFVVLPPVVWHHGETYANAETAAFYRRVTGWALDNTTARTQVVAGEHAIADLMIKTPETTDNIGWLPCFEIADLKRSVARIVAGGGRQLQPPGERPDLGPSALVADPQGAKFWIVQR